MNRFMLDKMYRALHADKYSTYSSNPLLRKLGSQFDFFVFNAQLTNQLTAKVSRQLNEVLPTSTRKQVGRW